MRPRPARIESDTTSWHIAGKVISAVTGRIALLLALHIVFVLVGVDPANIIVQTVDNVATAFVLGFDGFFSPDNEHVAVLLNYGFAAITYLVVGQLIVRTLQR